MKTINYDSLDYFENLVVMHKEIVDSIVQWIKEHKDQASEDVTFGVLERQIKEATK